MVSHCQTSCRFEPLETAAPPLALAHAPHLLGGGREGDRVGAAKEGPGRDQGVRGGADPRGSEQAPRCVGEASPNQRVGTSEREGVSPDLNKSSPTPEGS